MSALTVIETGEVVEQMTSVEAERITARIADKLDAIADNLEQVLPLIGEALTRRAWEALGYQSAQSYVSERFAASLSRLSPEVRRPVVAELSAAGMSTRQIAPIVGTSDRQVRYDVEKVGSDFPPAEVEGVGSIDAPAGSTAHGLPISAKIIGADGKEYTRPAAEPAVTESVPIRPRRRPLGDAARSAGWDIRKATERVEKILDDDRYPQNKEQVATHLRSHLLYVVETCQGLLDQLD